MTIIVALAVAVSVGIFARRTTVMSARTMSGELALMRSGIVLYTRINGSYPRMLSDLFVERYECGEGMNVPYVEGLNRDDDGGVVDPFGNRYVYDALTGWVRSSTRGYEYW